MTMPLPKPNQDEWEFARLCELISERRPKVVLEIGMKEGGWIGGIAQHCAAGAHFVSVDVRNHYHAQRGSVADAVRKLGGSLEIIIGDSRLPQTIAWVRAAAEEPIDLLHVDGLHTYHACRSDYLNYAPLVRPGGLIVLHDVHHSRDTGVKTFWDELRRSKHGRFERTWEWFHPRQVLPNGDGPMGIGVIEVVRQ